jgi:hypothetical protein
MFSTVPQRFLQGLRDAKSLIRAKELLDRFETAPGGGGNGRDRVRRKQPENGCACTQGRDWKITSRNICSLKAGLEYAGKPTALRQCLMVTPPIIPMIDNDGQVCRTIVEVNLTVDRTASGKSVHDIQCMVLT